MKNSVFQATCNLIAAIDDLRIKEGALRDRETADEDCSEAKVTAELARNLVYLRADELRAVLPVGSVPGPGSLPE